jgi:hypothetical protein
MTSLGMYVILRSAAQKFPELFNYCKILEVNGVLSCWGSPMSKEFRARDVVQGTPKIRPQRLETITLPFFQIFNKYSYDLVVCNLGKTIWRWGCKRLNDVINW